MLKIIRNLICPLLLLLMSITANAKTQLNFWHHLWGKRAPNSITALPYAYHALGVNNGQPNNQVFLFGLTVHGYTAGTFLNSFRRRVYYAGVERNVYDSKYFSAGYLLGIMHGYHGSLHRSFGKHGVGKIIGGDPGPLFSLYGLLHVTKQFSIEIAYFGVGGLGGVNFKF